MNAATQFYRRLAAIVAIAAVARIVAVALLYGSLSDDMDGYRGIADGLIAGKGYVWPASGTPTAFRPPLYPLVLAAVLSTGAGSLGIAALHVLLGSVTVLLTGLVGRRLGLKLGALIAAAVVAVDPLALRNVSLVMTETMCMTAAAGWLWCACWQTDYESGSRGAFGRMLRATLFGVTFGLCALCRPTFWAPLPIFVAILATIELRSVWRRFRPSRKRQDEAASPFAVNTKTTHSATATQLSPAANRSRIAVGVGGFVIGAAAVLLPWGLRNQAVFGNFILTTTHGGYTLLLSHNEVYVRDVVEAHRSDWPGKSLTAWQQSLEQRLAAKSPPADTAHWSPEIELARDASMNAAAWEFIVSNPMTSVRISLSLQQRFWGLTPSMPGRRLPPPVLAMIGAFHAATFVAAAFGLLLMIRSWTTTTTALTTTTQHTAAPTARHAALRHSAFDNQSGASITGWAAAIAMLMGVPLLHTLYWADMRMRSPIVPVMAILVGVAIERVVQRLRTTRAAGGRYTSG